jgi:hypothetical protein
MNVDQMKVAVLPEGDRPGRIAFTMTRYDLLRLAWNATAAALRGAKGIAIATGDLELIERPTRQASEGEKK